MTASEAAVRALMLMVLVGPTRETTTWQDVVESYEGVRDYTALYNKEERAISNGERQTIRLSFRKPLDVRLEWLDDQGRVDQTAVYRAGRNDGKVIARRRGVLGRLAGTVALDPRDRLALQDSRHPITEVGFGHIIDGMSDGTRRGRIRSGPAREVVLDGRPADQFEFDAASDAGALGVDGARRAIVWIDRELKLPVRVDVFGANDTLLERHRFTSIHINVGLTDETFSL